MPRISFPLVKVVDSAANETTANLYLELFNSLRSTQKLLMEGFFLSLRPLVNVLDFKCWRREELS